MSPREILELRRAVGAVLQGSKRSGPPFRGIPLRGSVFSSALVRGLPAKLRHALPPALAIESLLAGMRARFSMSEESVATLLAPALADWRDAVGCVDTLLVPENAIREPRLVPLPMPSWCTHLIDASVLQLEGPPVLEGARVVQRAWLLAVIGANPAAQDVECFPLTLAGRSSPRAAQLHVHLALSPPFASEAWRGPIWFRAAASRDGRGAPIWLGAPASPSEQEASAGASGMGSATWSSELSPGTHPRWAVLRLLEEDQPQALWDLPALVQARASLATAIAPRSTTDAKASMQLAIDIGSTTSAVVEEDGPLASVGRKLLAGGAVPSGFLRLAGNAQTAHRFGCAEELDSPGGLLPTALCAQSAQALAKVLRGEETAAQLWLPQRGEGEGAPISADRFKSPELLLHADWLAEVAREIEGAPQAAEVCRKLLESYAWLLGSALAAAHATPLISSEGGAWMQRGPGLGEARAILTHARGAWSSRADLPDAQDSFLGVLDGVGDELCRALHSAWPEASHRLLADPIAARAAASRADHRTHPLEVIADFGGLTLQIAVRIPVAEGRPRPLIEGSSVSYLLGGERLLSAAAYASASSTDGDLREAYRRSMCELRDCIWSEHAPPDSPPEAQALRSSLLQKILALIRRQLEGTMRRASPGLTGLRGAGIRLALLGEGWKLLALDQSQAQREPFAIGLLRETLSREPLLRGSRLFLERIDKRSMCEGALRAGPSAADGESASEIQGVDLQSGQRWFGLAKQAVDGRPALRPDEFFRQLSSGIDGGLLHVDQWFSSANPFASRLAAGRSAFEPRRSLLKQWLDASGPSLFALDIRDRLMKLDQG